MVPLTHAENEPMQPNTREPQAPESYATFWEPLAAPPTTPAPAAPADATKDAYAEFVNVTEGTPVPHRTDRA